MHVGEARGALMRESPGAGAATVAILEVPTDFLSFAAMGPTASLGEGLFPITGLLGRRAPTGARRRSSRKVPGGRSGTHPKGRIQVHGRIPDGRITTLQIGRCGKLAGDIYIYI